MDSVRQVRNNWAPKADKADASALCSTCQTFDLHEALQNENGVDRGTTGYQIHPEAKAKGLHWKLYDVKKAKNCPLCRLIANAISTNLGPKALDVSRTERDTVFCSIVPTRGLIEREIGEEAAAWALQIEIEG